MSFDALLRYYAIAFPCLHTSYQFFLIVDKFILTFSIPCMDYPDFAARGFLAPQLPLSWTAGRRPLTPPITTRHSATLPAYVYRSMFSQAITSANNIALNNAAELSR